jgi:ABC-type lipoprotein export system ATPase subunit
MNNIIELQAVERHFGPTQALRSIDLSLPAGCVVALSGPSGSGKTTLLNLVAGLDQPSSGQVSVLGEALHTLNERERTTLRRRLGLVFQSFALLPAATVYENIELGLRLAGTCARETWAGRVGACLEALGLERWASHRAYELSGGQQQRVAIARALAPGPPLVIADEPTGDLDATNGRRVLALFQQLARQANVTILLATHDPAAIAMADQQIVLHDGQRVAGR